MHGAEELPLLEARISGHVAALQAGESKRKPTMRRALRDQEAVELVQPQRRSMAAGASRAAGPSRALSVPCWPGVVVVQGREVLLQLEGRVELLFVVGSEVSVGTRRRGCVKPTSLRGSGRGPAAMSAALVPGCMRRLAAASSCVCSICCARCALGPMDGDLGPIWISAGVVGLGASGSSAWPSRRQRGGLAARRA